MQAAAGSIQNKEQNSTTLFIFSAYLHLKSTHELVPLPNTLLLSRAHIYKANLSDQANYTAAGPRYVYSSLPVFFFWLEEKEKPRRFKFSTDCFLLENGLVIKTSF